jgi:hypothetical protein
MKSMEIIPSQSKNQWRAMVVMFSAIPATVSPTLGRVRSVGCAAIALAALAGMMVPRMAAAAQYEAIPLPAEGALEDTLSEKDIPTGGGSFARDYSVTLNAGERVEIEANSDHFDTVLLLMASDGSTVADNDDRGDGSTNSMLFTRIETAGTYTIRVQGYGNTTGGPFDLRLKRFRPVGAPAAVTP